MHQGIYHPLCVEVQKFIHSFLSSWEWDIFQVFLIDCVSFPSCTNDSLLQLEYGKCLKEIKSLQVSTKGIPIYLLPFPFFIFSLIW